MFQTASCETESKAVFKSINAVNNLSSLGYWYFSAKWKSVRQWSKVEILYYNLAVHLWSSLLIIIHYFSLLHKNLMYSFSNIGEQVYWVALIGICSIASHIDGDNNSFISRTKIFPELRKRRKGTSFYLKLSSLNEL